MSHRKLNIFMAAGLLAAAFSIGGCGKNYDDPKVFTEARITDIAIKSANNWFPKDKKNKLKFKLTDISSTGAMGEENITFKGKAVLPETCYSILNLSDEIGLNKNDYQARNTYQNLHEKEKVCIVAEFKNGETVDVRGFYKRFKNPMDKKSEWEISYAEFHPVENLTLERIIKEANKGSRILKKGTPEFTQYLEKLKSEYEKEIKRAAEIKQRSEKLQKDVSDLSAEQRTLQNKLQQLQREYNRNGLRLNTLNRQVARETKNLNSNRTFLARGAQSKIDQANKEIKTLTARNAQIKEEAAALKKTIEEKTAALTKSQQELQQLK